MRVVESESRWVGSARLDRNLRGLDRDGIDGNLADYPDHPDGPNRPNKETLKKPWRKPKETLHGKKRKETLKKAKGNPTRKPTRNPKRNPNET